MTFPNWREALDREHISDNYFREHLKLRKTQHPQIVEAPGRSLIDDNYLGGYCHHSHKSKSCTRYLQVLFIKARCFHHHRMLLDGRPTFFLNFASALLTLVLLNCFNCIFRHLKLESLTQFPASNDEKYYYL